MSILKLIQEPVALGFEAPDPISDVLQGPLKPSHVLGGVPGVGAVDGKVADEGIADSVVGKVPVKAQFAFGQLFLAAEPKDLVVHLQEPPLSQPHPARLHLRPEDGGGEMEPHFAGAA
jgi:hypothetical protein